jgi:hypothetical protein
MKGQAFDADTVQIIGEAFDAAVRDLPQTEQPPLVREVIAGQVEMQAYLTTGISPPR